MDNIYLAFYKGYGGDWWDKVTDWAIRRFTGGPYSHCEIVIEKSEVIENIHGKTWFEYYSSSPRDGGVRCKKMNKLDRWKWDLIPLSKDITEQKIKVYFEKTKGKKYDYLGALGVILGLSEKPNRYFCSEWCYNLIFNRNDGYRFSPNKLAELIK